MSDSRNMTAAHPPGSAPCAGEPDKTGLRKRLLAARRALPPEERVAAEQAISHLVVHWCSTLGIRHLGVYWPIRQEPDLHACYAQLAQSGIELALPVVTADHQPLAFARWQPGEVMAQDRFGVALPKELQFLDRPPALLIPCVGFNQARFRLGYGGGFYDRTLAACPRPQTLGVAFACQASSFAAMAHDVALDAVATETGLV